MTRQPPRALIFDVDGTLAETEELHRAAFNQAFAEAGVDAFWSEDLYGRLLAVTGGKERLATYFSSLEPPDRDRLMPQIPELHARKTRLYGEAVRAGRVPFREGIAELIDAAITRGFRLAIATTTTADNVAALLEANLGVGAHPFEVIGAGDCVAAKKPAPDIYLHVLGCLRLEPVEALAVEDSDNGVRSANAAGIAVVATPSNYCRQHDFFGALAVVRDARAIMTLLGWNVP